MLRSSLNTGERGGLASALDRTAGRSTADTVRLFTCSDIRGMRKVEEFVEEVGTVQFSKEGVGVGEGRSRGEAEI